MLLRHNVIAVTHGKRNGDSIDVWVHAQRCRAIDAIVVWNNLIPMTIS